MRNFTKSAALLFCVGLAIMTAGCTAAQQAAGVAIDVATSLSSSTPSQVTTYQDATLVADATTKTIGWLADNAKTFNINLAALTQLNAINDSIHDAWSKLKTAHDANESLDFAVFNAALVSYNTYKAESAMPNPPTTVTTATMSSVGRDYEDARAGLFRSGVRRVALK